MSKQTKMEKAKAKVIPNAKPVPVKARKNTAFNTMIPVFAASSALLLIYFFIGVSHNISGRIIIDNDDKTPLKGVSISVDNKITVSDLSDDTFTLKGIKQGNHNLLFHKTGFKDFTEELEVKEDLNLVISMAQIINNKDQDSSIRSFIALNSSSDSLNLISSKENKNMISGKVITSYALNSQTNKLYVASSVEGLICVIDISTGKELNRIKFDSGVILGKILFSPENNLLLVQILNTNTIAAIDTSKDEILKNEVSIESAEPIVDILFNPENNKVLIVYNSKIASYTQFKEEIKVYPNYTSLKGNNNLKKALLNKNILLMLNPVNREIIKFELYKGEQTSIPLGAAPEDMVIARDGSLYVSSAQGLLYNINPETGTVINSYNTALDIASMNYSNDNIYILEKNSNTMSVFDTTKNELRKEKINLGSSFKEVNVIK